MSMEWIVLLLSILCVYAVVPTVRTVPSRAQMGIEYAVQVLSAIIRRIVGAERIAYALVPLIATVVGYVFLQGMLALLQGSVVHRAELIIALVFVAVGYSSVVRVLMRAHGGKRSHIHAVTAWFRMMLRHVLWGVAHAWRYRLTVSVAVCVLVIPVFVVPQGGVVAFWSVSVLGSVFGALYSTLFVVAGVCGSVIEKS
jgi:hypothetical protein